MIGLSPTRPGNLPVMPPVEVAAARLPCLSRATAPTVPCRRASSISVSSSGPLRRCRSNSCCSARQRLSVWKYSRAAKARPCARQKARAPSPISSTCGECSITARAASPGNFALAIHGGAGTLRRGEMNAERAAQYHEGLRRALQLGRDVLAVGGSALDAVTAAVVALEDE